MSGMLSVPLKRAQVCILQLPWGGLGPRWGVRGWTEGYMLFGVPRGATEGHTWGTDAKTVQGAERVSGDVAVCSGDVSGAGG